MLTLKKVTLQYSPYEDRIRISGEHDSGDPVAFLLTMRMSRMLAGLLCTHLERTAPEKRLVGRDMQLACMQRDAEWQLKPAEPVRFETGMAMYLPEKFDLSCTPEIAAIAFPAGSDRAELKMNMTELRQFLSVFYRLFRSADWPMDAWPEWFIAGEPANN
ncbi:MAG: hypothetical protein HGB04_03470 [Chlorobiaceae bacterium]|nr:hypothetical protein [Chlorobiaceae bacterium]